MNNMITHIAYVLDDSGSMQRIRKAALKAFNEMIAADQAAAVGLVTGRVFIFSDEINIREIRGGLIQAIAPITLEEYTAQGFSTPLCAATLRAIRTLESMPDAASSTTAFLVKVVTDGIENSSGRTAVAELPVKLNSLTATDRWTFAFSCPASSVNTLLAYGIPRGNIQPWEQTDEGVERMSVQQVGSTQSYFAARATGQMATRSYFEVNANELDEKKVARACHNVQTAFRSWLVDREVRLDAFIRSKGLQFEKGRSFYQLTKKEKVQPNKQVLLKRKKGRAIYDGDVRGVLGMPAKGHLNLDPGNVGEWEIFVQSNSDNRLLVRGSRLLYRVA